MTMNMVGPRILRNYRFYLLSNTHSVYKEPTDVVDRDMQEIRA